MSKNIWVYLLDLSVNCQTDVAMKQGYCYCRMHQATHSSKRKQNVNSTTQGIRKASSAILCTSLITSLRNY